MKNYHFNLVQQGNLVGEGFGQGNNAMEAFEHAVESGGVFLPRGEEVTVVAESQTGIAVKFDACKVG